MTTFKSIEPSFDSPVPGQAMTAELGSRPWQTPSQYKTIDEVIDYYTTRMSNDEFIDQLSDILKMEIPLTTIAHTMQMTGVMEGLHNADLGIMVSPVLMEMMMLVGDSNNIDYVTGLETSDKNKISPAKMSRIMNDIKNEMNENTKDISILDADSTEEIENTNDEIPVSTGLMTRKV